MKTKIVFNDAEHSYTNPEKIKYTSVSTLIGKYKSPFNGEYWSTYKAYEKILGDRFKVLKKGYILQDPALFLYLETFVDAKELELEILNILKSWDTKKNNSIITGNNYHAFKEQQALNNGEFLNPFSNKMYTTVSSTNIYTKNNVEYREPIVTNLIDLEDGYHPELILWDDEFGIAGQADAAYFETLNNIRYADINDYKTGEKIKKTNYFGKMSPPIGYLDCCNLNHYKLQISLYAKILQKAGFVIRDTAFTHLNEQYKFDMMEYEVDAILQDYIIRTINDNKDK